LDEEELTTAVNADAKEGDVEADQGLEEWVDEVDKLTLNEHHQL